jgi:hypothetical protein
MGLDGPGGGVAIGLDGPGGGVAIGLDGPGGGVAIGFAGPIVGVPVAATVGVVVTVGVAVRRIPTTVALSQSFARLAAASMPAVHALLVHSPSLAMVADTDSCIEAPGASPLSNVHWTYPVLPSTDPWLEALTKLTPFGSADSSASFVNGTIPGFVTVYVKLTGSPTSAWLGATELSIDISAQGLTSSGGVCCAESADITKL